MIQSEHILRLEARLVLLQAVDESATHTIILWIVQKFMLEGAILHTALHLTHWRVGAAHPVEFSLCAQEIMHHQPQKTGEIWRNARLPAG